MTRTPQQFVEWCLAHPTDTVGPGTSWDQKCASLVFRAGGFKASRSSAYRVAVDTRDQYGHKLYSEQELSFNRIPFGWMVYFDKGGVDNGHVGMSMGDGRMLNANFRVTPMTAQHKALGYYGIEEYAKLAGCTYLGAAPHWLGETLDLSSLSGGSDGTQPPTLGAEGDEMYRLVHVAGDAYMVGPSGLRVKLDPAGNNYHLGLAIRVLNSSNAADPMLAGELDIVASYQRKVTPAAPPVDTAAVTKAVLDALAASSIKVDTAAVATAVEAALKDDFAAVNANVDQIPLGFEITPK